MREDFFETIDTEEKAYWLGFLYADGYNHEEKREVKIGLAARDEDFLLQFRDLIFPNKDKPLYYHEENGVRTKCELSITSVKMSRQLAKHGCMQAKTFKIKFPYFIDESLCRHFIRGYFDGDGSLSIATLKKGPDKGQKKVTFSIVGHKEFLTDLNKVLSQQCGLNENKLIGYKNRNPNMANVVFGGRAQCVKIREYLYKDATIFMKRKYDKFLRLDTDEFTTAESLRVNLYTRTVKLTESYIDPNENEIFGFLVCCHCGKRLISKRKIYDVDKLIYCYKCCREVHSLPKINANNGSPYVKRRPRPKKMEPSVRKLENNIIKIDETLSILRIKDVDIYFDTEDTEIVNQRKWHIEHGRVVSRTRYPKQCLYLNRLIVEAKTDQVVKFKDGNRFNLRKENLELRDQKMKG